MAAGFIVLVGIFKAVIAKIVTGVYVSAFVIERCIVYFSSGSGAVVLVYL